MAHVAATNRDTMVDALKTSPSRDLHESFSNLIGVDSVQQLNNDASFITAPRSIDPSEEIMLQR